MRTAVFALLATAALAAEPRRVTLLEELVRMEAMERRAIVQFPLEQQDAQLEIRFEAKSAGEGVQILVYEAGSTQPASESKYLVTGTLRLPVQRGKSYRVEVANLRQRLGHGLVDLEVALVFGLRPAAPAPETSQTLDPRRRYFTIAASLALFAMIVTYSAIRLAPPVLARWRGQR